ncbi:hypothetical protein EDD11_000625 [Mortierella claussenii]|nr:hypothetical protein EDD11_000625 [Mortierella claussenii]
MTSITGLVPSTQELGVILCCTHRRRCRAKNLVRTRWKEQDIRNIKERIKQQRQMQSIKDAFHQQSSLKVRMYSELQTRLHQLQPGAQDHSDSHKLKAILDICLNEISRIARTIAVEGATLSSNHLPDGVRVQDLYRLIHESDEGGAHFFSGIQRAKESRLSLLVAVEQDRFQKTLDRDEALEAPELIQLFRDHHLERVVQIESVFNKLSACEREMDELYTRMRFQTQQREHEGKPALFYQKLEEVKAHLKGVGIALEFIQAEQENLVERVVSQDEQETTLEAISRASRAADLKTVIHRLVEMINISLETRSRTGGALQEITTRSLSEGLSELSSLAQDLQHTAEEDSTVLQNMAQQSRRFVTGSYDGAACACMPERQRSDLNPGLWQEIVAASCLSSDQHHLQIARSQRFNTAQRLAILKARKDNAHMSTQKDGITTTLNALISGLQGTQGRMNSASNARGHFVSVDSLSSAFEYMVKNMSGSLMHLEDRQHAEFQKDLQHIVQTTISGGTLVKSIQGLVEDECAVAERFAITKKPSSVHKKIRYM